MKDVVIRPAREADAEAVFGLLTQFAMTYEPDHAAFERNYPALLQSDRADLLVATLGDQVVGYALAADSVTLYANGAVTQLQELMVDPQSRGTGIGQRLVEAVTERARTRGSVELTVPTRRAGDYYLRLGFEETAAYFRVRLHPSPTGGGNRAPTA